MKYGLRLEIDTGNDAMRTVHDLADALEKLAAKLRQNEGVTEDSGSIKDINGNSCGVWGYALADE